MSQCVIHKYQLREPDPVIDLPFGAEVLFVREQDGVGCIWVRVQTDIPKEPIQFHVVGTGRAVEPSWLYHGTYVLGSHVWHVFEETLIRKM